jgi:hypothetical protein
MSSYRHPRAGRFRNRTDLLPDPLIIASGRKFIGFDLDEIGVGDTDWDANVGARILWKLCNLLVASNDPNWTESCTRPISTWSSSAKNYIWAERS